MPRKHTRREAALLSHERRRVEKYMEGIHARHRILIRAPKGHIILTGTLGELRDAEIKRDGLGNCVKDSTYIQL